MPANYQATEAEITLEQGIVEYRELNPELDDSRKATPEGAEFFRCHDVVHVIFGCDTSLLNEAMADAWTLFGTTVTLRQFLGFMKVEEHQSIMETIGWPAVILTFFKAIPAILLIALRSTTMTKRWPWDSFSSYLQMPLGEIRREFHIRPIVFA